MAASIDFGKCPYCDEIRNMLGMKQHIRRCHSEASA